MANKNDNYYFIHGNEVGSQAIYVPYKASYVKNVRDISDFDIATIEMGEQLHERLQEANPGVVLTHTNYIGKFPYAKGIKIFKPIELLRVPKKAIKIVNGFRDFSEERNAYYYAGKKLDLQDTAAIARLVDEILSDLSIDDKRSIFGSKSFLGKDIKDFYYENGYNFHRTISNYTQLRNLLIAYLNIKQGKDVPTYFKIDGMAQSLDAIKGLYPEDASMIKKALLEYKEAILIAKNEAERAKAEIELKKKTIEPEYTQLTLFDLFPEEKIEAPVARGRVKDLLDV